MVWTCDPDSGFCDATRIQMVSLGIAAGGSSFFMILYLISRLLRSSRRENRDRERESTSKIKRIGMSIKSEAKKYLTTGYRYMAAFNLILWVALVAFYTVWPPSDDASDGVRIGACFLAGVLFSACAGFGTLSVSTEIIVRSTRTAGEAGISEVLRVVFTGASIGAHLNLLFGVFGVSLLYYLMTLGRTQDSADISIKTQACEAIVGFGLGSSTVAVFSCVAGGIYSSAANTGVAIFRQTEMEDDMDTRRNPIFIASIIGKCVSSVSVIGGESFVSLIGSIIAAAILAEGDTVLLSIPFWVSGAGIIATVIGFFVVRTNNDAATQNQLVWALRKGVLLSSVLVIAFSAIIVGTMTHYVGYGWRVFGCISIGVVAYLLIDLTTVIFTSSEYRSVKSITAAGVTGPATVIIQGLGIGMVSCFVTVLILLMMVIGCDALAGKYGVAISAVGMISTLGITLSIETIGPMARNLNILAKTVRLENNVSRLTNSFEDLGSTVTASGRGAAIASSVFSSLSLFIAFKHKAGIIEIDLGDALVMGGVLYGSMLPFLFTALMMLSVQKTVNAVIIEAQDQFSHAGVAAGHVLPHYGKIVEIVTNLSLKEMILPGVIALMSPLITGFLIGPIPLAGMLAGAIASGMMLSIMMSNAGCAWRNSYNNIEIKGAFGGTGTDIHSASIVGDDVCDSCKDTSAPTLNVLIKLMCMMSLTIAPIIKGWDNWDYFYIGIIPIVICFMTNYIINACGRHSEKIHENEA